MKSINNSFKVGKYKCILVADGTHTYENPSSLLFSNAPEGELAQELIEYKITLGSWANWTSDYTCVVVDTGKERILLETGAGTMLPSTGKLHKNLQLAGICPTSIDYVLITHAHPDHIGGVDFFPNAQIIMSRKEWSFWMGQPELPRLPEDFKKLLIGMVTSQLEILNGKIELLEGSTQIVPGITMIEAPGHTPGHMVIRVDSQDQSFIYGGDVILHPVHILKPHWTALVDVMPETVETTRINILKDSAKNDSIFFGLHMPSLGKVYRKKNGFDWCPLYDEAEIKKT